MDDFNPQDLANTASAKAGQADVQLFAQLAAWPQLSQAARSSDQENKDASGRLLYNEPVATTVATQSASTFATKMSMEAGDAISAVSFEVKTATQQLADDGRLLLEEIARAQRQIKMLLGCLEGSIVEASRRAMHSIATVEERLCHLQKLPASLGLSPIVGSEETLADIPQLSKLQESEMVVMTALAQQLRRDAGPFLPQEMDGVLRLSVNSSSAARDKCVFSCSAPVFPQGASSGSIDCVLSSRLENLECSIKGEIGELREGLKALMEAEIIKSEERQLQKESIHQLSALQGRLNTDVTDCFKRLAALEFSVGELQKSSVYKIYGQGGTVCLNRDRMAGQSTTDGNTDITGCAEFEKGSYPHSNIEGNVVAEEHDDLKDGKARDVVEIDTRRCVKDIGARKFNVSGPRGLEMYIAK